MVRYFAAGTYSVPILFGTGEWFRGKGEGLYLCALEDERIRVLDCLKLPNPSFAALNEAAGHIYAVNELKEWEGGYGGGLTDIVYDARGRMTVAGQFPTHGTDPCHAAVSPDGRLLCVSNYGDGRVTVFRLDPSGAVLPGPAVFRNGEETPGRAPHAHSAVFSGDGQGFYSVDLGLDALVAYRTGEAGDSPVRQGERVCLRPDSGPRTGEWSPDGQRLYLMNEKDSTVTCLKRTDRGLEEAGTVSALPPDWKGPNAGADLHLSPDGGTLYASNRGHDSIAVFRTDGEGGLRPLGWVPSGGRTPRNFATDPEGKCLLAANQDSDLIRVFALGKGELPVPLADCPFPTPVCLRFFRNTVFQR